MRVEIDQSGKKIEKTHRETVLAFSNGTNAAVVIPAKVKKDCIRMLRKESWKEQTFIDQIFAAGVFLLLKTHLSQINSIVIDVEYPGREANIKGMLLDLIGRTKKDFPKKNLTFTRITKHSRAHHKAYNVYKRFQKPDKVITTQELLAVLGK